MSVTWEERESSYLAEATKDGDVYSLYVEQSPNDDRWIYTIMLDGEIIEWSRGSYPTSSQAKGEAVRKLREL